MKNTEHRALIAALGRRLGPEMIAAAVELFAADHDSSLPAGVNAERDIQYGPDQRHRLDLFLPNDAVDGPRPVLLFIHGGGFTGGDKKIDGQPFYDNVGRWSVENGFVGATMTYRLAPDHQWPAGAEDVAMAIDWLSANVGAKNGDPTRIFLMGHSAGAVHAVTYIARPEFHSGADSGVAGAILVSGLYNIATTERNPAVDSYFGDDPALFAERSSVPQIGEVDTPMLIAVGEYDPPDFGRQALELARSLCERDGTMPRLVRLHGHNHYTEIMAFNLPYSDILAREILEFVGIDCNATS